MQQNEKTGALAPLANPDFRWLLGGFAIGQMLMPLQFITQILLVQHYAPEDVWLILVALIATSRGLGSLTFGLYGGALADRFNRKWLLVGVQLVQLIGTLLISLLMYLSVGDAIGFGLFFLLTFLTAGLQSIDAPTRLAIVPDILGMKLTPAGMSLNQVVAQIAMPIAMMFTGLIIHHLGFAGAYLVSAAGHVAAILMLSVMHYEAAGRAASDGKRYGFVEAVNDIRIGLSYARHHHVLLWVITLIVLMMSLGYPATASLGPSWITAVVEVPIADMGYIVMFWGVGSFIAAITMMRLVNFRYRGALVVVGAVIFALGFVIFVYEPTPLNAIIGNIALGAGMSITMVSSTILIQHLVESEVRGRVMSIFQLNMAFAQLMTMPVAMLGQWLTLQVLFPVLSFVTLAVVIVLALSQPQVARAQVQSV